MIASRLARAYLATLRVNRIGALPNRGIIALWHEDLAVAMKAFAHLGISVLLSASRDGEIATETATALGYRVLRGSSSRQGAAGLRKLLRSVQALPASSPCLIGMALDGPRGPRRVAKPGTLWLADTLQFPVYPLGTAMRRGVCLRKSWDQARLPLPYLGKACAVLGRPSFDHAALMEGMHAAEYQAKRMLGMAS